MGKSLNQIIASIERDKNIQAAQSAKPPRVPAEFPADWVDRRLPNPGIAHAFRRRVPVATVDRLGCTHVVWSLAEYEAVPR